MITLLNYIIASFKLSFLLLLVVKRKRGRPKGSTKKYCADEELAENNNIPSEEAQPGPEEGTELAEVLPGSLECKKCNRKFSNTRQLRKHICIIVLNEGEDEGDPGKKMSNQCILCTFFFLF